MDKIYVIRAPEGFKDGQIPECPVVLRGRSVQVPENVAIRMLNSDDTLEHIDTLIPNPIKKAAKRVTKEA